MRYLGNKTRLLDEIHAAAARLGLAPGGHVIDGFAGSAAVARSFRERGHRVTAADLMESSFVAQRVTLETEDMPEFRGVSTPGSGLDGVQAHLEALDPVEGIFVRQYSPAGEADRRFFTPEIAGRIDAAVRELRRWHESGATNDVEHAVLTWMLIAGSDRRANISGTYGAFLKKWQQNATQPFELRRPDFVEGPVGRAHHDDLRRVLDATEADLVYLDPPYNHRQYPANYHLFEVICRAVNAPDVEALEASVYGKTGLIPWKDRASELCSQRGTECRDAFRDIVQRVRAPRLVVSYSEEGILTGAELQEILAEYADCGTDELEDALTEISFLRFRSDADGRVSSIGIERNYKTVPGREKNEVREWLFHVKKPERVVSTRPVAKGVPTAPERETS